ncbi:MAG: hypothetical protein JOZ78_26460 [Chroococcidiopsidaceae cyanobacterium CP_BM_ER_R8_30]|nr:hypothetical protein [Chroococcidiopsidaceae cyanobacterium CP_BM_ER_R8_30]
MTISELSFQSVNSIFPISFYLHRVDLKGANAPDELAAELGKLANRLRRETKTPIVADTREFSLLSPYKLISNGSFEILSILSIDITAPRYRRQLEQILNQYVSEQFRSQGLRVDAYKREAFLETVGISEEIEAQRFLKWDLRIDAKNYVFLSIDYSNEYHSRFTLAQRDLSTINSNQPLVHTYDGKTCRYVELAKFTVAALQSDLGNISLLEYHRRKGEVSVQVIDEIPLETPAIYVNYGSKGIDKIYPHIPQLLKKAFTKDDIEAKVFNAQVWSIDSRFKAAIREIEQINNSGGLSLLTQKITFNTTPYCPSLELQRNFAEQREKNLDFGRGNFFGYPTQGLKAKELLEKPSQIKAVVFFPNITTFSLQNFQRFCNHFTDFLHDFQIELKIEEYRPYLLGDTLEIQRKCRDLTSYELALMFVPNQEKFINSPERDPYPIFKREFVKLMLPSQAIEASTFRSGFNKNTGYNLLLGILGKLGYCPWHLRHMPGEPQAFLGLDVGRKNGVAVGVAAFIVSPQGRVIGWFPATFQAHRETFDLSALRHILFELINLYEEKNQTRLYHLVIHRDGYFQTDELELLDELIPELSKAGIQELDAVEILKSGYTRAGQWNETSQKWENPRRGWGWSRLDNEVALMTTGKTEIKGGTNFVPRPITVRRQRGNTKTGVLAAQAYWLSEMHLGSTQTIRLPITTYYPDVAAEYALEGLLPTGLQISCKLPF